MKISELSTKYDLRINKLEKKGNILLIDSDKGKYVIKKNKKNEIINYLNTRNFNYYPEIIDDNDDYIITKYIEEYDEPLEYKIMDMVDLISLLHSKTTFFKEVSEDEYKEIYEDINNNVDYLLSYYDDIMTSIESNIYMSPSEYLLASNINIILKCLDECKTNIQNWYNMVKEKTKMRMVILHNNLKLDHFIKADIPYLISWDKSKIGMPVFDLYKLYKRHGNEFDFVEIIKRYEIEYPLLEDEKLLFNILITMPDKIEIEGTEIIKCEIVSKSLDLLTKALKISNNY